MMDIALVAIPRLNIDAPPMGIASIKGSVVSDGYTAKCFDVNINLYHSVSFDTWLELDSYFQTDLRYTGTSLEGAGSREINFINIVQKRKEELVCYNVYKDFLETEIKKILEHEPEWIGLSVFSVNSVISTVNFLSLLKEIKPDQKVVAGGMGLSSFGLGGNSNFGEFLIKQGLITTYISGEGELAIIDLLKESRESKLAPQIGDKLAIIDLLTEDKESKIAPQINDLNSLPFPEYDDFDLELYPGKENMVYITGSRGCVRACTFCDINSLWKKFRYRSGENIAAEILAGYKKYNTIDFYFTDSLINGNMKEFVKLLDTMIDYKEKGLLPDELMFGGQFIARPMGRFPEEYYAKMQAAGVYNISVGMESGSDRVLADMRKGTTRADHDYMMEMLQKYGIRINLLMLIGYPTETEEDFEDTLDMIKDYKRYSDSGIIWGIVLGKTMVVLPNTPIADSAQHWNIAYDDTGNWISTDNSTLTYHERVKRRMRAGRLCEDLGYVIKSQIVTVNSLHEIVTQGGYDSIS
tara:strand:- start:4909 stop:6480 length:1572 start_codon:yes stop_codon:yes gene_type:complete